MIDTALATEWITHVFSPLNCRCDTCRAFNWEALAITLTLDLNDVGPMSSDEVKTAMWLHIRDILQKFKKDDILS